MGPRTAFSKTVANLAAMGVEIAAKVMIGCGGVVESAKQNRTERREVI